MKLTLKQALFVLAICIAIGFIGLPIIALI